MLDEPYSMIGVSVTAAESDERARELAAPQALAFLRLRQGRPGKMPTPEETAAHPYTPLERQMIDARLGDQVMGGPDTVRRQMDALIERTGVNEVMVMTQVFDHADRIRSYEIVAGLYDLKTVEPPAVSVL
ncbi:LLM class oxidoreductase [Actinomadura napierensis]